MKQIIESVKMFIPSFHITMWLMIGILVLMYFKTFMKFLKEMFSEKNTNGTPGKISNKRVGVTLFALAFIYVFIYSMHTDRDIDHYVATLVAVIVVLGWQITSPEALGGLIDKIKGFTNPKNLVAKETTTTQTEEIKNK